MGPPGLVKSLILLRRDCFAIPNPVLHPLTHKPFGLWVRSGVGLGKGVEGALLSLESKILG
jgi:hypothetical protein